MGGEEELMANILELPEEINSKLAFFQQNLGDRGVTDTLVKITTNLSEKVKLNSIVFSKNLGEKGKKGTTIVISGTATDRDALVSFGATLRESKSFTTVEVPVSSLAKDKDLPFSMNIFIEM